MSEVLRVESLVKHFRLDKNSYVGAVNGVSLTIAEGETLGLVGESGSGKSTLGRAILRLVEPTSGRIVFDGQDLTSLSDGAMRRLRSRLQLVFQEPGASLNPRWRIEQIVEEPLVIHGVPEAERRARVRTMLEMVGLDGTYRTRRPGHLTGSEQQRVGIARALVTRPRLVVLDEPTSTLDQSVRGEILDVLLDLQREFGTSYLLISHDLTAIAHASHRLAVMYLGRMVELGPAREVFARQHHPYSKALLSAVLHPDPRRRLEPFLLRGEIPSAINPRDMCPLVGRCPMEQPSCAAEHPPLVETGPDHLSACLRASELLATPPTHVAAGE